MSVSHDFGISPVLLQAISSLTSGESRGERSSGRQAPAQTASRLQIHTAMDRRGQQQSKVVSHLLQGMNEPVSGLMGAASPPSTTDSADGVKQEDNSLSAALQERLASQLISQGKVLAVTTTSGSHGRSASDLSMVNVLTALATQHMRANIKQETDSVPYPVSLMTSAQAIASSAAGDMIVRQSEDSADDRPQPQIIIYYNNEIAAVPSPGNDVIVGELESEGVHGSVQNYRVVMHNGDNSSSRVTLTEPSIHMVTDAGTATGVTSPTPGNFIAADSNSESEGSMSGTCPICTDKLSGYHYGVFTCESCKGFFKRTVQNKKTFACHKNGVCEINVYNRKKCPACRFAKCLAVGMRLEAIRQDRTRGGRSSYEGCSPHGKPRAAFPAQRKLKRTSSSISDEEGKMGPTGSGGGMMLQGQDGKGHRQLVAILNHSRHGQQVLDEGGARIPELLTDIMNLEALLADDDLPQENCADDLTSEQAFYNYLMQLTELRLYKLVRWARNLPQFGAISTDDQIILLQNCWSDLLALGVCWRSVQTPSALSISTTRAITLDQAETLGFGDVVGRLLSITQDLQRINVDQYEYVSLKVLLLITPDVKGLKEPSKIRDYQEKLSEALFEYTSSHYAHLPAKYGEMLLRLPELARVSFLAKEILLMALPPSSTSCGLLVELLKGENAVKD